MSEVGALCATYADAVAKEALRLRPVLPLVVRKLTAPVEAHGYELPVGTAIAPCIYLVHRRPEVYRRAPAHPPQPAPPSVTRQQPQSRYDLHRPATRMPRVPTVRVTTDLPLPADAAFTLACKPELFLFVVAPILKMRELDLPATFEAGARASGRLWWFGVIPTWRHHLEIVRLDENEIYTNEHGGPVHTWNHRLTFQPLTASSCRYTDEIEIDPGLRGIATRAFVRAMFAHRHRRWRQLARLLA